MQLFEDFEDFGTFDDAVSGDVRDPYRELADRRRRPAHPRPGVPLADVAARAVRRAEALRPPPEKRRSRS